MRDLTVRFVSKDATVHAVNGVDFDLAANETLCILGESGSGKSVTLRSLMRLNPPRRTEMTGTVRVGGHDMVTTSERSLADIRGSVVSMIFQEPMTALDPVFTIGAQIRETILPARAHQPQPTPTAARWSCWSWCRSRPPSAAWPPIRTSCPAACASAR